MRDSRTYDVVIVGSGVIGATLARVIVERANKEKKVVSVLILEAGRGAGLTQSSYAAYLDTYYEAWDKVPNSPYPNTPNAPAPSVLDFLKPPRERYFKQTGPLRFDSNNTRALGGTTLHWLGIALRMMPNDFRMASEYGQGVDWPLVYEDLKRYYEMAEWELGVAADVDDQIRIDGIERDHYGDYLFPMHKIPTSYGDKVLADGIGDKFYRIEGKDYPVRLVSIPQARNSNPIPNAPDPRTYLDRTKERYRPLGAPDDQTTGPGQRCEGNASCIPICPSRAKYSALKTIQILKDLSRSTGISIDIVTNAVASKIHTDSSGRVTGITYQRYEDGHLADATEHRARGRRFVLAASAIENAKLLLGSRTDRLTRGLANESDMVGRNLMDHPFVLTWALMPKGKNVGPFRGPGATSDLPMRDGAFRRSQSAFRTDVANWGWALADNAPYRDVERQIDPDAFRSKYSGKPHADLLPASPLYGADLRKKLYSTVQRQIRLGFLLEQLPSVKNRVTLDDDYTDPLGNHRPVIHYDVSDYTRRGIATARALAIEIFGEIDASDYTDYGAGIGQPIQYQGDDYKFIGAGHIMGTHRMGTDRTSSVVDRYQRSWDHRNLFIVGCGSMPTAGTSNPTLTAVALAIMSAEEIYCGLDLSYK